MRPDPATVTAGHPSTGADVERLGPWFHNLHLPDGTQTAPDHALGDFPRNKWETLAVHLPVRLDGWTALDVGCNAGFYSFELARRGARVTGIDVDPHFLAQATWAARAFGLQSQVGFERMQVYDLARDTRKWDLVLFMGVFYHLRYPLLGLDLVSRCCRRRLVFQSLMIPGAVEYRVPQNLAMNGPAPYQHPGWPSLAFIENYVEGDPTNWWVPNHAAVEALLRSSGLQVVHCLGHEIFLAEPAGDEARTRAPYDYTAELLAATGRPWW